MFGTVVRVVVNRLFGWAQGSFASAGERSAIGLPFQSSQPSRSVGGFLVRPSNQTSCVFSFQAMLVKIALVPGAIDSIAVGLVFSLVSLATPKTPFSGFMPYRRASSPTHIQAMSSP